jgi:biotin transport system substrate-specific component
MQRETVLSAIILPRRLFILSSLFTALTAFGAQIRIPLPFVPLTLQTFFVMLSGHFLGPIYGAASQIVYLLLGLLGLPIFAEGGGVGYIFKPTFGYLLGFPLASFAAGMVIHHQSWQPQALPAAAISRLILANVLALSAIFVPGVIYLWFCTNFILGKFLSFPFAWWSGCLIFLPGDLIKIVGVILLYLVIQPRLAATFGYR